MAGRNLQSASSTGAAVAGVILCGGGSRRMQSGEKPLLVAGEKSLLQLVIDQVAQQVRQVVLSCGTNTSHYGAIGLPVITDQRNDAGPLAGVEAALADVEGDLLFFCPGDAPRFPAGDVDAGFKWLDKAVEARVRDLIFLKVSTVLADHRQDPRYLALLQTVGLPAN